MKGNHVLRNSLLAIAYSGALALVLPVLAEEGVPPPPTGSSEVERGQYLVTTSGCHDCHTPLKMGANGPVQDMSRALSGHPQELEMPAPPALPEGGAWGMVGAASATAFAGEWGVSFTANLTPDMETGIGKWSFENFRDTIRSGRHLGRGRPVLPPMPWPMYRHMKDEDLRAVYAYLQSLPPIKNRVPEPLPPAAAGAGGQ
jgi:mono/diheme cytochrome c family protein